MWKLFILALFPILQYTYLTLTPSHTPLLTPSPPHTLPPHTLPPHPIHFSHPPYTHPIHSSHPPLLTPSPPHTLPSSHPPLLTPSLLTPSLHSPSPPHTSTPHTLPTLTPSLHSHPPSSHPPSSHPPSSHPPSSQCVAYIVAAELPAGQWPDIIAGLLLNVSGTSNTEAVKEASLEAIGYICEELVSCNFQLNPYTTTPLN